MNGSGSRSSLSVMVSPMNASSNPQMPMMSPALACCVSTFARPTWVKIAVTFARSRRPSFATRTTLSPTFTRPLTIRP